VWQSTGGTDDFEPKLSLTPLVFGTLKGTFYALLFAIPVALLSALYTSQFMHPAIKAYVKPTVEIMAALPSVVLGFIAGLWLAPMVERTVPGLFLMPWVVAALVLVSLLGWRLAPLGLRSRLRAGTEVFLLIPVVLAGAALALIARHARLVHPAQQEVPELALHELRQARAVLRLRHRAQKGLQVFGDHLVQHGVLGVSRAIHGRDASHASG